MLCGHAIQLPAVQGKPCVSFIFHLQLSMVRQRNTFDSCADRFTPNGDVGDKL